jgi:hypothetical protein
LACAKSWLAGDGVVSPSSPVSGVARNADTAVRVISAPLAGVNYLDRPATTILAGWKRGMISL